MTETTAEYWICEKKTTIKNETQEVKITGFNMPFWDMVAFMFKWMIAR